MSEVSINLPSKKGEPTWEAAYLLPPQGGWTEEDFFKFHTNRMAELVDGNLEVLPMPTWLHQLTVEFLFDLMRDFVRQQNISGKVLMAPLPARLFPGTIREPDLLFVRRENFPQDVHGYPGKVDLAVEIVNSGADAHRRDYVDKRIDYAKAGISEYWIVDHQERVITVLGLDGTAYQTLGTYGEAQNAIGRYWPTFHVSVDDILSLANTEIG